MTRYMATPRTAEANRFIGKDAKAGHWLGQVGIPMMPKLSLTESLRLVFPFTGISWSLFAAATIPG